MTKRATDTDTEVLEVAVELQAQAEAEREAALGREAVREAAVELGVEEQLARAEEEVERRRLAAEARRERRSRRWRVAAGLALAVGIGLAFWRVTAPTPPTPWTLAPERAAWVLDVSRGTEATLGSAEAGGHTLPEVTISRAAPRADGTWFVNLDRMALPAFAGHETLVVALEGTLPRARVYLEAGEAERWRSPPLDVQPRMTEHRLPLSTFERQVRRPDGTWHVVGWEAPRAVTTLSVKLGHFVNEAGATGLVRVGEIRVE